jgi:hypothetical protein
MKTGVLLIAAICLAGLTVAAWREHSQMSGNAASDVAVSRTSAVQISPPSEGAVATAQDLAETRAASLLALENAVAANDPIASTKRRAILMEWFHDDFAGAFAYCKALGFEDLDDAAVAQFVAKSATIEQLADIVAHSASPFEVTRNLCIGAGVEKVQQLRLTADRYTGEAGKGFAGGVSVYLAEKNIDAAIQFAVSRSDEAQRSAAVAGVVDQLAKEGKNSEAQFLYDALDERLRESDPVKFAYGQSLHDADPETALGLLYSIQDPALKQLAVLAFARKVEAAQPGVAIAAVMTSGIAAAVQTQHVERIVSEWLALDRASAREWLATAEVLPDELRTRLQQKVK